MPSQPSRLHIAAKIHFFLMRELGHGIDVGSMLNQPRYARDVLLVCEACRGTPLADLAQQYRAAEAAEHAEAARHAPGGHAEASLDWAAHTSGFGVTRPGPVAPEAELPRTAGGSGGGKHWFSRLMARH
jgi:hypothetical protein